MFSNKPNYIKLRTNLRLCINRLKLLEKKKTEMALKARREIADYIVAGKDDRARIRVEHIIREDYLVEAMEIIEMLCDLILARFGLIEKMNELDPGIEEAIATMIWVTPRMSGDIQELREVSNQLTVKYGKEFAVMCLRNGFENVNEKVVHKMNIAAPPKRLVENYMVEIARSYNVPFEPDPLVMLGPPPDAQSLIDLGSNTAMMSQDNMRNQKYLEANHSNTSSFGGGAYGGGGSNAGGGAAEKKRSSLGGAASGGACNGTADKRSSLGGGAYNGSGTTGPGSTVSPKMSPGSGGAAGFGSIPPFGGVPVLPNDGGSISSSGFNNMPTLPPGGSVSRFPPPPLPSHPPNYFQSDQQLPQYDDVVRSPDQYRAVPGTINQNPSAAAAAASGTMNSGYANHNDQQLNLPARPNPLPPGVLGLPELPSVPTNSVGMNSVAGDDVDFDDLTRRFEDLKRKK